VGRSFLVFTLVAGPERSLILKLSDARFRGVSPRVPPTTPTFKKRARSGSRLTVLFSYMLVYSCVQDLRTCKSSIRGFSYLFVDVVRMSQTASGGGGLPRCFAACTT